MTPRHTALVLAALMFPDSAFAQGLPDPRFSTCDPVVVGNVSGAAIGSAPAGFDVTLRDVNNAPLVGHVIVVDFSSSAMRLLGAQNPGTTIDCAGRRLSRVTNAQGAVNFAARVAGYDNTNAIAVIHQENGEILAHVKGRSTDLDGADGMTGLGDFALFAANFLNNPAAQETDFDQGGNTGLGDFALFSAEFLRSTTSPYCP